MYKALLSVTILLALTIQILPQQDELFIQREFKNAVKKGTRTMDGVPSQLLEKFSRLQS